MKAGNFALSTMSTYETGVNAPWGAIGDSALQMADALLYSAWDATGEGQRVAILEAYISNKAFLRFFRSAVLDAVRNSIGDEQENFCVLIFGSYGRMDAMPGISDCDLMVIHDWEDDPESLITKKTALLAYLANHHRCLHFDHREVLESGDLSSINHDICYPFIKKADLIESDTEELLARRVQILTEARALYGYRYAADVVLKLLEKFGLIGGPVSAFPPNLFVEELRSFHSNFWKSVVDKAAMGKKLTNRKIAKVLTLREALAISNWLTLIYITFNKAFLPHAEQMHAVFSLPVFARLRLWLSNDEISFFARLGEDIQKWTEKEFVKEQAKDVTSYIRRVRRSTGSLDPVNGTVRGLVFKILSDFNYILSQLHDPATLKVIDGLPSDYLTWRSREELKKLVQASDNFLEHTRIFAKFLDELFKMADEEGSLRYPYSESLLSSQVKMLCEYKSIYGN